jgi:hypothetical protein
MGIGYVLALDDTVTEIRCTNLGIAGQQSFMNTTVQTIEVGPPVGGKIVSFRLGFAIKDDGEWSAFMMQGEDGGAIIATSSFKVEDLAGLQ